MSEPINGEGTVATSRERFYIGGVGGLMPVLVFLATGDFTRIVTHGYAATIVGYCVRAIILFLLAVSSSACIAMKTTASRCSTSGWGPPQ